MMDIRSLVCGALLASLVLAAPAFAGESRLQSGSETLHKLGRGVAGVALGVLEVPGSIVQESRENGALSGMTVGVARGLGRFVTREFVGLYQVVSAPFAEPEGLEQAVANTYPWQYFEYAYAGPGSGAPLAKQEEELAWIRGIHVEADAGSLRVRFPGELLFSLGSATLQPEALPRLRGLAETLLRHPQTHVIVQGHTDATGPESYNLRLSHERAIAVRSYLTSQGVAPSQVEAVGYGESMPIASNDTRVGRRSNRRVDFVLHAGDVAAGG